MAAQQIRPTEKGMLKMAGELVMTRFQALVLVVLTLLALLGAPLYSRSQIAKAEVAASERVDRELQAVRRNGNDKLAEMQAAARAAEQASAKAFSERDQAIAERLRAEAEVTRLRSQLAGAAERRIRQRVELFAAEHFDDHRSPISPYRWEYAGFGVSDWGKTAADGRRSVRVEVRAKVASLVGADTQPRSVFLLDFNGDGEMLHWKRTDSAK